LDRGPRSEKFQKARKKTTKSSTRPGAQKIEGTKQLKSTKDNFPNIPKLVWVQKGYTSDIGAQKKAPPMARGRKTALEEKRVGSFRPRKKRNRADALVDGKTKSFLGQPRSRWTEGNEKKK